MWLIVHYRGWKWYYMTCDCKFLISCSHSFKFWSWRKCLWIMRSVISKFSGDLYEFLNWYSWKTLEITFIHLIAKVKTFKGGGAHDQLMRLSAVWPLLTQYTGVGEPPGFTVGGVWRVAVGLTRVVCACCKTGKKKITSNAHTQKTHINTIETVVLVIKRQSWDIAESCVVCLRASICSALAHNSPTVSAACKPLICGAGGWLRVKSLSPVMHAWS